jgi:hypothetical protein
MKYRVTRVKIGEEDCFEIILDGRPTSKTTTGFRIDFNLSLGRTVEELRIKLKAALDATYLDIL